MCCSYMCALFSPSCLQELITNTSLAELEKQLKEGPFKPPKVGKSASVRMCKRAILCLL